MGQIDSSFSSRQGLQDLFRPLSPDLVALQLVESAGSAAQLHLGAIRFNLLETNQSLFLSETRRPKPCTVAIPLEKPQAPSPYRAQGIPVEWPALMGYNRHLTDFDLRLPAGARLATIVIGRKCCCAAGPPRRKPTHPERWRAAINSNCFQSYSSACAISSTNGLNAMRRDGIRKTSIN